MLKAQVETYSKAVAAASKTYARTRSEIDFRFLEDAQTHLKYFTRKMHETAQRCQLDIATVQAAERLAPMPANHPEVIASAAYLGSLMPNKVKQELAYLKRTGHDDPRFKNNPVLDIILATVTQDEQRSIIDKDTSLSKATILFK